MELVRGVEGSLNRYRILANIVGVGLATLVFIGMPLQFIAHNKSVVEIVGPIHGFFYIAYLASGFDLINKTKWKIWQMIPVVLAGLVPILAFIVEHLTTKKVKAEFDIK
jgi:integral membrane protein